MRRRLVVCAERIIARHGDGGGGRWCAKLVCGGGDYYVLRSHRVRVNDDNVRNAIYQEYQRWLCTQSVDGKRTNSKTRL